MDLNVSIVLLFTLFTAGHSLKCHECLNATGPCVSKERMCPAEATICTAGTLVKYTGNTDITLQAKSCNVPQNCLNGSLNFGVLRMTMSMQCCNTDLCNNQGVSDVSSNNPNKKQCYTCNEQNCENTLDCLGNEDYCITVTDGMSDNISGTGKGCVSKSICDVASKGFLGFMDISCCEGNLCNSAKNISQNFLLSWLFFSYILFH